MKTVNHNEMYINKHESDIFMDEFAVCHIVEKIRDTSTPVDLAFELSKNTEIDVGLVAWEDSQMTGISSCNIYDLSEYGLYEKIKETKNIFECYDVIHTHHHRSGFYSKIISKILGKKIIHTDHNNHKAYSILSNVTNSPSNLLTNKVVCVSDAVSQSYNTWEDWILTDNKKTVVYNGANLERTKTVIDANDNIRDQFGIPNENVLIGNASMHIEQKAQEILIEAVSMLDEKNITVILTGGGPELENNKRKAEELNVENNVIFTGYIESRNKIYNIMNECDLFCYPSRWEGHCISVIEAMSFSKPCILSNIPEFKIPFEDVAVFHKLNDPNDLANKIKQILNSQDLYGNLGSKASNLVHSRYTINDMTDQYVTIYNSLLNPTNKDEFQ